MQLMQSCLAAFGEFSCYFALASWKFRLKLIIKICDWAYYVVCQITNVQSSLCDDAKFAKLVFLNLRHVTATLVLIPVTIEVATSLVSEFVRLSYCRLKVI
jgi:hypothetical protein